MRVWVSAFAMSLCFLGCGGDGPPAKTAADEEPSSPAEEKQSGEGSASEEAEEEGAKEIAGVPTECAKKDGDICTPPKKFVDRLCQDVYPNVAFVMFSAGSPWTRGYMTRKTEAWNAMGGASVAGWLEFDEEVILLYHRAAPKGGMQVSGAGGGYQALRLNGACVTLSGEEVTTKAPPRPKYPKVEWKWIEPSMREALRENDEITEAYRERRRECKGVTIGTVSKKCIKADEKLSKLIIEFITQGGGELAEPEKLPE